jgi:uncharacterized membrane protein
LTGLQVGHTTATLQARRRDDSRTDVCAQTTARPPPEETMMESHAKAAGHAIHQQLIVFPLGLLATAVVFDVLHLVTDNADFATASYYMIAAGIVSGLLAAVFGAIDYLAIPARTRAKRVGAVHGLGNVVVVALFAVSWLLRADAADYIPSTLAFVLALAAAALSVVTGWLGGELVDRLGVGIDDDAHLDASASFTTGIRLRRAEAVPAPERP